MVSINSMNKKSWDLLTRKHLSVVIIESFYGKKILDIGLIERDVHFYFHDNSELILRSPGSVYINEDVIHRVQDNLMNNTEGYLCQGAEFISAEVKTEYLFELEFFKLEVDLYFREKPFLHCLGIVYKIPIYFQNDLFSAEARYPNDLNGEESCLEIPAITKKNTKPTTEHLKSKRKGQRGTKPDASWRPQEKSIREMEGMLTMYAPSQREVLPRKEISESGLLPQIDPTQEPHREK